MRLPSRDPYRAFSPKLVTLRYRMDQCSAIRWWQMEVRHGAGACGRFLAFQRSAMKNEHNVMENNGPPHNPLRQLLRFDTCTLSNAIERCNVRPRNEGFMRGAANCCFPHKPPVAGHAVTGRIRTYMRPVDGRCYYENIDWWRYVESVPAPRIIVLQDFDQHPGFGALFGEIHARISRALDCVAYVTNGAVRDVGQIEKMDFQVFAGSVSVSHAYAHVVDFGSPVHIGGLEISPGEILHGDRHGILSVPDNLIAALPDVAESIQAEESELVTLTHAPDFSVEKLAAKIQEFAERQRCS